MIDPALAAAAAQSQAALDAGTGDAYDFAIVALLASERRDFAAADTLFDRALALEPGNPSTLTSLAMHRRRQGRYRDALLACDAAIRAYPDYPDAWLERGITLAAGGSNTAGRDSMARAATLNPGLAAAWAGLASLAARDGDGPAARDHAQRALALNPANATAINALAQAELLAGEPDRAGALLTPLIARLGQPTLERCVAYGLLADADHRGGRHVDAYHHYAAANADFAAINAGSAAGEVDHHSFVEALIAGVKRVDPALWATAPSSIAPEEGAGPRHLFLIGNPRSGTTLVENILASLPGVAALEEMPTFEQTDRAFISGTPAEIVAGLAAFAALDAGALSDHRRAYWAATQRFGAPSDPACFVDMDPLKATRLPFIARLFPGARVLIMRRDPRDVVWSCFKTNFALSSGALQYTTLEGAARHYDAMMRLTELALERLPLATHEVWYHKLVQDFDAETRALCAFAGLEWSEDVRNFDRTAIKRGVTTASVGQVRRGLYDGTRQWEPYAEFLAPVMPILQPWVDKFGYDS
jgi:tetratricopeptide (TPR) repeat protein